MARASEVGNSASVSRRRPLGLDDSSGSIERAQGGSPSAGGDPQNGGSPWGGGFPGCVYGSNEGSRSRYGDPLLAPRVSFGCATGKARGQDAGSDDLNVPRKC